MMGPISAKKTYFIDIPNLYLHIGEQCGMLSVLYAGRVLPTRCELWHRATANSSCGYEGRSLTSRSNGWALVTCARLRRCFVNFDSNLCVFGDVLNDIWGVEWGKFDKVLRKHYGLYCLLNSLYYRHLKWCGVDGCWLESLMLTLQFELGCNARKFVVWIIVSNVVCKT